MDQGMIEALYTALEVVIAVACCLGNLLVIWVVWTCGAMRKQPTFCFIISLATADFLVGAVAVPLAVLVDGRVRTTFNGCLFPSCGEIVVTQASVHSLLIIAVDRFLRVFTPLRYKTIVTQLRSWTIVGVCWLSAVVLGFIPMFGWYRHDTLEQMQHSNSTTITCTFLTVIPMTYMVYFNFFTCILLPLVVMATLYLCIFLRIHQQLGGSGALGSESRSYYLKERKLTRSLGLVLLLFGVSWLPLHFMNTAAFYGAHVPHQGFYIGILLTQANSAVNPIVYAFSVHKIKMALRSLLKQICRCGEEKEETERQQSSQTPGTVVRLQALQTSMCSREHDTHK